MFRVADLLGTITLVPSSKVDGQLRRQAQDYKGLPSGVGQVVKDLATRRDGVPATFSEPRTGTQDWSLLLYTSTYFVRLFQTKYGDAYTIAEIRPIRLRDHDRLARGCLLVRARWQGVFDHRQIPKGAKACWNELFGHWQKLQAQLGDQRAVPALSARHAQYLDTLDHLIDATQRITTERAETTPTYPYRAVESASERRFGALPVYVFRIAGDRMPDRGAFVQIRGEMEQRGQVVRAERDRVTVRFDGPVDWDRLAQQGELEVTQSNVVFDKQRESVALIRTRQARNRTLLPALVDHQFAPVRTVVEDPGEDLDDDQLVAFRKALGVQDMLVVLGPPGTGKTRTISQIARAYALSPERGRVLVASHTNRAVDNVLAKLPRDVVVVRVGNEGKVDPEGKPFLLEQQAADLSTEIIAATDRSLQAYQHVDRVAEWTGELGRRTTALATALDWQQHAQGELERIRRAVGGSAQSYVDSVAAELANQDRAMSKQTRRVDRLARRRSRALAKVGWPLLGPMFGALVRSRDKRIAAGSAEIEHLRAVILGTRDRLREAENALDLATRDVPEVQAATHTLQECMRHADEREAAAKEAAKACRALVSTMDTPPAGNDLTILHGWLVAGLPLLTARAKLLQDWNNEVRGTTEQLYPELIRYADVIGATCIGAASRPEISGVDFDVAIVDEAGQIGVTDLLVPLVRAQRSVLVGDHRQLPPYVEAEVGTWGRSLDPEVRDMLTKSALEILVDALPDSHIKQLNQQRRMPVEIAEFISNAFYDGELETAVTRTHHDPLFRSPIAFVDTTRLPESQRAEQKASRPDSGYVNEAEATLLSGLAAFYHRKAMEWALIVPYMAQVKMIKELLGQEITDSDTIEGNVGTVDSFQGGERDVILYGFVRSNPHGNVGFLDELRRANVAFTRAKQQLVLVGDMSMLVRARDDRFRELARKLRDHIKAKGDVRRYEEIRTLLL